MWVFISTFCTSVQYLGTRPGVHAYLGMSVSAMHSMYLL